MILALKGCLTSDPLWLVATATSLSPLSLVVSFFSLNPICPSVPLTHALPQLEVAALSCRPRSRLSWLEALMLLLFPALWCHLKEGPAHIPRAVSQSQGGWAGSEDERAFSDEEAHSIQTTIFVSHVVTWSGIKNMNRSDVQKLHTGVNGLICCARLKPALWMKVSPRLQL